MDIDIRPYTDVDKLAVLSLIKLNTPLYFAESEAMDFAHYLDHEKEMYFVACIDGEVVGCGGINFEDNHNLAKISWDMVHPLYHGKNVGTKLLKMSDHRYIYIDRTLYKISILAKRNS